MTILRHRFGAALLTGAALQVAAVPRAFGADFLLPGIQAKAAAGAGQTVSRGASALFFNPANLSLVRGVTPEADLSLAQVTYSYQNADAATFQPATIAAVTPLLSFGLAANPLPQLSLGAAVLPTGLSTSQADHGVPIETTPGHYEAESIVRTQTAFRLASGAAWQATKQFSAGLSLIYSYDSTHVLVTAAGSDQTTLKATYSGTSLQVLAGGRYTWKDDLVFALSYKTPGTRPYHGTLALNTASTGAAEILQETPFTGVGYDPAQFGFGAEGRYDRYGAFIDLVFELWGGGRSIYKQGLGSDSPAIDLKNSTDFTVGARFWPRPKQRLEAAIGLDGGNMGTGDQSVSGGVRPAVGGVKIGQLEAIPRTVASGAYRYSLPGRSYLEGSLYVLKGTRTVPAGYGQAGTYTLQAVIGSAGAAYEF